MLQNSRADGSVVSTEDTRALDAAVENAMRQPFNLNVPEEHERLVEAVRVQLPPTTRMDRIRKAVKRKVATINKPQTATAPSWATAGQLESGDNEQTMPLLSDFDRAINDEVDRVLDEVTKKIKESLRTQSYLEASSPEHNEFYICISVQYHSAAARATEHEVRMAFCRDHARERPLRPFYRNHLRFNVHAPLAQSPKDVFITAFFFQWLQDPRSLPPSQLPTMQK